jgi:Carboxypeptidase regulatory-like domain
VTRRYLATVVAFLLIGSAAISFSQNANTSLHGVIKDSSGALVPMAKIALIDDATGHTFEATSSSAGEYAFAQIPPAKYVITVSAPGFGEQRKSAELLVNQPATIDFTVAVKASEVVVNVSAEAQTLNTTDASLGNSMNNTLIQALPSEGRNIPDLLSLQPGVLYLGQNSGRASNPTLQNDSRSGAVNGGRSDQGNITVDGLDDNDQVNGFAFTGVLRETQDSVEEFRVTTGLSNADQGRSSGAQVSMVTKSGTNKFHGSAYEYNRPTLTVSNDWFNKASQVGAGEPNIPPKLIRNNFGGALGGPIFKDKLFFFGNYEGQRQAENQIVSRTAPTASYQQGIITYLGDDSSGNVQTATISPSQLAALDVGCTANGVCPWGPGNNPNVLAYLNQFPAANGTSLGDGLNTGSFTFSSPNPVTLNTSIARIDFTPGQKHRIFVRGNLQKDTTAGVEQFPGQGPSYTVIDNTKGIAAGDTWTLTPNLVNDARYGYIRQGFSNRGPGTGDYVDFRFMDTLTSENRSTLVTVPVNNIVDNLSWTKGKHSLQFGGNWRLVQHNRGSDALSYNSASSNPYWLGGNPPDPSTVGGLPVDSGFSTSYGIAYANLVGTIPQVTTVENYNVTSPTAGSLLPEAAFINRHFKANEFEWYIQDSWRALPNLTVTFGVRHTILQTPYESKGQQVSPTIDTHAWFLQRNAAALVGQVYEPDLTFAPSGPFYHKPGFWPKQKANFAPRLAVVYSPDTKTTVRAGFGIFFDHYGEQLVDTFDQQGSFGTNVAISNPAGVQGYETSPRFTGRRNFPSLSPPPPAATITYPYTAPTGNFGITWGIDNRLKTPYSESIDFSIQRQVPAGFTFEANYVGRLGRHLLQSLDLAEPVDFRDTQSGVDYFTAAAQLSAAVDANGGVYPAPVTAIPYFEDVFPFMAGLDYLGESATQAIYNNEWAKYRSNLGATTALADIDFYCSYGCPSGTRFWQDQFSSLYALDTIGTSYYNAAQLILRHPTTHGLNLDFSYTFSKSIDMGSDAERSTEFNNVTGGQNGGSFSSIINTWNPSLNRGVSDFDTRHLITADWVYLVPVGQGRKFLNGGNFLVNAFLGGWQWSGINRWTSGLPFTLFDPGWGTDWQQESGGVVTGKLQTQKQVVNGSPVVFANANAINSGTTTGSPIRLSYPGEAGERNHFRGDGIFGIDSGLSKAWQFGEYGSLKFAWEVFNVTNSVRFNDNPFYFGDVLTQGNLGTYSAMQNLPRRMQFGLRYDF